MLCDAQHNTLGHSAHQEVYTAMRQNVLLAFMNKAQLHAIITSGISSAGMHSSSVHASSLTQMEAAGFEFAQGGLLPLAQLHCCLAAVQLH